MAVILDALKKPLDDNVPAGQYHIQKLHSLVEEDVNFGLLKPNGHSDALCKKWSQSQAR